MTSQISKLPKIELHSHLEGTLKPELVNVIAKRNGIHVDQNLFDSHGEYAWTDFASFLSAYDAASSCLKNGNDYRDITYEYFKSCASENVIYAETFISPDHAAKCGITYEDMIS